MKILSALLIVGLLASVGCMKSEEKPAEPAVAPATEQAAAPATEPAAAPATEPAAAAPATEQAPAEQH